MNGQSQKSGPRDSLPHDFSLDPGGLDDRGSERPSLPRALQSFFRGQTLTGFEWRDPYWVSEPTRLYRPEGLLVVRAPAGARLVEWFVGKTLTLPMSRQPLHLSTFAALDAEPRIPKPTLPTCEPGTLMRIRLDDGRGGTLDPGSVELATWGTYVDHL